MTEDQILTVATNDYERWVNFGHAYWQHRQYRITPNYVPPSEMEGFLNYVRARRTGLIFPSDSQKELEQYLAYWYTAPIIKGVTPTVHLDGMVTELTWGRQVKIRLRVYIRNERVVAEWGFERHDRPGAYPCWYHTTDQYPPSPGGVFRLAYNHLHFTDNSEITPLQARIAVLNHTLPNVTWTSKEMSVYSSVLPDMPVQRHIVCDFTGRNDSVTLIEGEKVLFRGYFLGAMELSRLVGLADKSAQNISDYWRLDHV